MTWRYILTRTKDSSGNYEFEVRELYTRPGTDKLEYGWTAEPVEASGSSAKELEKDLKRMLKDIKSGDLLDLSVDPPRLVLRLRTGGKKK